MLARFANLPERKRADSMGFDKGRNEKLRIAQT